jgi:energy-coupling factor transporter ATP-binding protein EcfA2
VAGRPAIQIDALSVRYPGVDRPAIESLSLDVDGGQVVGLLGLTGAGKTTLLRSLNGIVPHLIPATIEGSVVVEGVDVGSSPVRDLARRVGMVLDDPEGQLSQPTVAEEVALGLEALAVPWPEMTRRIAVTLDAVGLHGFDDRAPLTLSGGEQQRLAIACALAMRPRILALDEPTANLDPSGTAAVIELVGRLNREQALTVMLATHDVELLAEHADRILVLDQGRLVADGPPAEVLGKPDQLAVHGLRPPQVTEAAVLAARQAASGGGAARSGSAASGGGDPRSGPATALPVTMDAALTWFGVR